MLPLLAREGNDAFGWLCEEIESQLSGQGECLYAHVSKPWLCVFFFFAPLCSHGFLRICMLGYQTLGAKPQSALQPRTFYAGDLARISRVWSTTRALGYGCVSDVSCQAQLNVDSSRQVHARDESQKREKTCANASHSQLPTFLTLSTYLP